MHSEACLSCCSSYFTLTWLTLDIINCSFMITRSAHKPSSHGWPAGPIPASFADFQQNLMDFQMCCTSDKEISIKINKSWGNCTHFFGRWVMQFKQVNRNMRSTHSNTERFFQQGFQRILNSKNFIASFHTSNSYRLYCTCTLLDKLSNHYWFTHGHTASYTFESHQSSHSLSLRNHHQQPFLWIQSLLSNVHLKVSSNPAGDGRWQHYHGQVHQRQQHQHQNTSYNTKHIW